jgi:hypothetical protein
LQLSQQLRVMREAVPMRPHDWQCRAQSESNACTVGRWTTRVQPKSPLDWAMF